MLALSFTTLFIRWSEAPGAITQFYRMGVATVFLLPFAAREEKKCAQPGIQIC